VTLDSVLEDVTCDLVFDPLQPVNSNAAIDAARIPAKVFAIRSS
jgi:hypothetical protein